MYGSPPVAPSSPPSRWWLLLPFALTVLVHAPALVGAEFVTDDWSLLANHLRPGDLVGEWARSTHGHAADRDGYVWRPLVATLHQVVGEAFGRTPAPFRLLNLTLHLVVVGGALALVRRDGASRRDAALLLAIWASWPPLVDAVAWSCDTYDLAAAAFGLAALRAAELDKFRFVLVFAATLAACLSKEPAVGLALAVPLYVGVRRGAPAAVVPGAAAVLAALAHGALHRRVVGASPAWPGASAAWTWADMSGWPVFLGVDEGFLHVGVPDGPTWSAALGALLLVAGVATAPTRAAAVVWAAMLVPAAAGAAAIGQEAWRYAYLPSALAVACLGGVRSPRAWVVPVAAAVLCAAWAPRAASRAIAWRSELRLAEQELAFAPDNALAAKVVGRLRVASGDRGGFALWEDAIARAPSNTFLFDVQRERLDLAVAAARAGEAERARRALDAFVTAERAVGRALEPSVLAFDARLRAASAASP